jgi:hypothetical protein
MTGLTVDVLELLVRGHWFFVANPLIGQFPAHHERVRRGTATLHLGGTEPSALLLTTWNESTVR